MTNTMFKQFNETDRVDAKVEIVTTGMWSGDDGQLTDFFTSSLQSASLSGDYYYNIYNKNPDTDDTAEVQFAIAYGNVHGSGSLSLANDANSTIPSKANYAQYRSTLLNSGDALFSFESSSGVFAPSEDIFVINVSRALYRERVDPGNWQLTLKGTKNISITLIDDSGKKFGDDMGSGGDAFKIVSGSLNLGTSAEATVHSSTSPEGYGFGTFYPKLGIFVLNPAAIVDAVGLSAINTNTDAEQRNHKVLINILKDGGSYIARRTERIATQHFFVRATNREFNFTNNPSFVDDVGNFRQGIFRSDPTTYITTIGLMNDNNELIAVAKTSQPIKKSFSNEILIRVKLSF